MDEKALRQIDALQADLVEHGAVFDVLGHGADAEILAQGDDAAHQRPVLFAVLHAHDEIAFDLEKVDWEALDIVEGRKARAEIVDRQLEAFAAQAADEALEQRHVLDGFALGDLEHQARRVDPELAGDAPGFLHEIVEHQRAR